LWIPGNRESDFHRFAKTDIPCGRSKEQLLKDIATCKAHGRWRDLPGQAGSPTPSRELWDPVKLTSKPQCQQRLKECLKSLRITQQNLEGNALFSVPFFDPLMQVCSLPILSVQDVESTQYL
jgi:hypothetical protein